MASIKEILTCIGVDTSRNTSVLVDLFGFARGQVPTDPDPGVAAEVSVLQQVRGVQGQHIHLNVIRVGFDLIPAADADEAAEKLDYAIYRIRNIYRQVDLGVGRVEHFEITSADANGRDNIGSLEEADELSDEFTVDNSGIDVFVVRIIISNPDFVGVSPRPGSCVKGSDEDGLVGGEIDREFEGVARTFAHEVGHFLNLPHNHGAEPDCPATDAGKNNLMAQTRCAPSTRNSVLLTSGQGNTMRGHCSVQDGC
jgi:hypothetical protein